MRLNTILRASLDLPEMVFHPGLSLTGVLFQVIKCRRSILCITERTKPNRTLICRMKRANMARYIIRHKGEMCVNLYLMFYLRIEQKLILVGRTDDVEQEVDIGLEDDCESVKQQNFSVAFARLCKQALLKGLLFLHVTVHCQ